MSLRLQRLGEAWRGVALFAFNTVIMAFIGLAVLDVALNLRHRISGIGQAHYSRDFDLQSYRELAVDTAREVGLEYDRMGEKRAFAYAPWTTFKTAPFTSQYINIVDEGVITRRQTPPPDSAYQGKKPLLIWAFGGSTMFGWGMPDALTLPAMLQQEVQALFPDRQVRVLNYGQPYWFSSAELSAFVAMLRDQPAPDVALFLDGLNDSVLGAMGRSTPFFAARAEAAWEQARADDARMLPWFAVTSSFPVFRVMEWLQYKNVLPIPTVKDPYAGDRPASRVLSERIWRNWEAMRIVGQSRNVTVLHALQPIPWIGQYSSQAVSSGVFEPDYVDELYGELEKRMSGMPGITSLARSLDNIDRPYVDTTHYSDAANRKLALALAGFIRGTQQVNGRTQ